MSDIIFKIGPRINASGRMENGKKSVDLLVERIQSGSRSNKRLTNTNEQRKDVDHQMTEEANQIVARLEVRSISRALFSMMSIGKKVS